MILDRKIFVCAFAAAFSVMVYGGQKPWMNRRLPVDERVRLLMAEMTLEEKIAQMDIVLKGSETDMLAHRMNEDVGFGSWLGETTPEEYNRLQRYSLGSRLQIPYLFGCDVAHGDAILNGRTVFPTPISMAATWNPDLVEHIYSLSAEEARAAGTHQAYSPCVDIVQDARWGRAGETFGECPTLASVMAASAVRGYQGNLDAQKNIIATAKHLYGGGASLGGVNHGHAEISERMARSVFLRPFKAAIDAGALSIMPGHNDVNGIPCHANRHLLTDVVKGEFGFGGFLVTDAGDIENLRTDRIHRIASTQKEAIGIGVNAGLDMHMYSATRDEFINPLKALVSEGMVPQTRIDDACRRILTAKFRLGLFENRFLDLPKVKNAYGSQRALDTALEAARQCVVLLKNKGGLLPLDTLKYKRILVTGPNADNNAILGDWTNPQPPENITTLLEGIRQVLPGKITYVDSGRMKGRRSVNTSGIVEPQSQIEAPKAGGEMNDYSINEAVEAAKASDVAIVCIGGYGVRYEWDLRTYGESCDRPSTDFYGRQTELVQKITATGIPVVVVIVGGTPLNNEWVTEHADAMLYAWEPGMRGGQAVAEILAGKVNPSGKLPITIPKNVGQLPMYYYQTRSRRTTGYSFGTSAEDDKPAFCFGHGLSYTTFALKDADSTLQRITEGQPVSMRVKVSNTGSKDGYETVMAFVTDDVSSVVTPLRMLGAFSKVWIKAGETKTVDLQIPFDSFKLWNADMKFVAEPGSFTISVGSSVEDIAFKKGLTL
jgi:beta-glucosidase